MNAGFLKVFREADPNLHKSYIRITNGSAIRVDNYENNHIRCNTVCAYINHVISTIKDKILETTDVYIPVNYDDDWDGMDGVLCFSKQKQQRCALMPDLYQMMGYGPNIVELVDRIPFENKLNKVCFDGTTTGSCNPSENKRVNACLWSINNRDISEYYITNIVQMDRRALETHVVDVGNTNMQSIYKQFKGIQLSMNHQLNYKYIASIDGNTAAWDRPVWIMKSNSIMFRYPSDYCLWYSSLARNMDHYIDVNATDVRSMIHSMSMSSHAGDLAKHIRKNAQQFVQDVCIGKAPIQYTRELLLDAITYI